MADAETWERRYRDLMMKQDILVRGLRAIAGIDSMSGSELDEKYPEYSAIFWLHGEIAMATEALRLAGISEHNFDG